MARSTKTPIVLIVVLLVVLAALSYYMFESYRNVDCAGINCNEGEFCQDNTCHPIYPPITNNYN